MAASTLYSCAVRALEVGNGGLAGFAGSTHGSAGLAGAGAWVSLAGAGGGGAGGGLLQALSYKASKLEVQTA